MDAYELLAVGGVRAVPDAMTNASAVELAQSTRGVELAALPRLLTPLPDARGAADLASREDPRLVEARRRRHSRRAWIRPWRRQLDDEGAGD